MSERTSDVLSVKPLSLGYILSWPMWNLADMNSAFCSTGINVRFGSVKWHRTSCSYWSQRDSSGFRCGDWGEVTDTFLKYLYPVGNLHHEKASTVRSTGSSFCTNTYPIMCAFLCYTVGYWLSGGASCLCKLGFVPLWNSFSVYSMYMQREERRGSVSAGRSSSCVAYWIEKWHCTAIAQPPRGDQATHSID